MDSSIVESFQIPRGKKAQQVLRGLLVNRQNYPNRPLWLGGGSPSRIIKTGGQIENREATKVSRLLIGMADADMEDAYDAYMGGVKRPRKNKTEEANE